MEASVKTDPSGEYEELMRRLLDGRARGLFDGDAEDDEDRLLEEMDAVWWKLTDAEQQVIEQRREEARRIHAPEKLGAQDSETRDHVAPRRAA